MPTALPRDLRKLLQDAVKKARVAAETGALRRLHELGVAEARRPEGISEANGGLRNRLRAHARALGDTLDTEDAARLARLVREIAYAHWHRALFARFLMENGLLVDTGAGNTPISRQDVEEIANEERKSAAEVAAEFAAPMLPEIFRTDDPVLALSLPEETRQEIEAIVGGLSAQTFKADDALGWTYQFWQEDRKKRVNESEVKIGADELPAVTQLFTEDYMVLFLLENTLGAWWAGKRLAENPELARDATDEDELRRRLSPPGYAWTYLRFVRDTDNTWHPAAGTFPGWPATAREITVLDPCMGSGHFLVFALAILVAMRRAEEALGEAPAVEAVLRDNLHGLEIDPRCTQIAAFALALAAWKRLGGVQELPRLNLACSGLAIGMDEAHFVKLAERIAEAEGFAGRSADLLGRPRDPMEDRALALREGGLKRLYQLFKQAPVLGSLIDPRRALGDGTLFEAGFDGLADVFGKVLEKAGGDPEVREAAVTAQGLAKAAELLSQRFTLVATNVPYLGRRDMTDDLKRHVDNHFSDAKGDLATCFIERMAKIIGENGAVGCVAPQSWTYSTSFNAFRISIIKSMVIPSMARLGSGAFETVTGEVVNVGLYMLTQREPTISDDIFAVDADKSTIVETKTALKSDGIILKRQDVLRNPAWAISFESSADSAFLGEFVGAYQGTSPGDGDRLIRTFWEQSELRPGLEPFMNTPGRSGGYAGREHVIFWSKIEAGFEGAAVRGRDAWGRRGFLTSKIAPFYTTYYTGELFSTSSPAIVVRSKAHEAAVYCFMQSEKFSATVQSVNANFGIGNGYFAKLPFNIAQWQRVAAEKYPNGLALPTSNDPTQWLFDGHPRGSANPNQLDAKGQPTRPGLAEHPLQVAVARLLGYRWPRQTGSSFVDCPAVTEPDEIELSGAADTDGIVCLPSLHGEAGAAERVRGVLRAAWGPDWAEHTVQGCLAEEGAAGKSLEDWLADDFFENHCRLFHQTPFIWHVWDGAPGGFSALVNYHKLCSPNGEGRRLLEKLRDTYLGEWIARLRRRFENGDGRADDLLAAADYLADELTKIIEGEPPYDIFVRWKPLNRQPIGWEPDIDDGVRLNIRPFLVARPRYARARKACILRVTPGIKKHEGADRGAEPSRERADFPWFWAQDHDVAAVDFAGSSTFRGRRYNDFHYTRHFKAAARAARRAEAAE